MFLLVCYDVPAPRCALYHELLNRYLLWKQNSVFMGDLTLSKYKKLRAEIKAMRGEDDRVTFLECANRHNINIVVCEGEIEKSDTNHKASMIL